MGKSSDNYNKAVDKYILNFKKFEKNLNGESKTFFHHYRKNAINQLKALSFPTLKNEKWRFTNVLPLLRENFKLNSGTKANTISDVNIDSFVFKEIDSEVLVFVNGVFNKKLSKINKLQNGVIIGSLQESLNLGDSVIKKHIGKYLKIEDGFDALNAAFTTDGVFVYLPKGVILQRPIQVLFVSTLENIFTLPRNLIIAQANTQAKIIFNYVGENENTYFTDVVDEIAIEENSIVDIYKIQNESKKAYHLNKTVIHQGNASTLNHFSLSFGALLCRNDLSSKLDGEGISCNLNGLYLGNTNQHVDNYTLLEHSKPNSESSELYKGILDDKAHGVFHGKILVHQDAQKTNAYQTNKTILLSDDATINTKPQLEIYADDVKCSHGATVGQLDKDALFYIKSRGIPSELAKSMLIRAFVSDVIEKISIDKLKEQLNHFIFEHLSQKEINL